MTSRSILKTKLEQLIEERNQYELALKDIDTLRNKKNETELEVIHIIQNLDMEGKTIIVNNQKVLQRNVSTSHGLTFKYIENVLEQYNNSGGTPVNVKYLMKFIKTNRPTYTKTEIKIS